MHKKSKPTLSPISCGGVSLDELAKSIRGESDSQSAGQEIPHRLWNQKFIGKFTRTLYCNEFHLFLSLVPVIVLSKKCSLTLLKSAAIAQSVWRLATG